jgi:hypothetical protein
VLALFARGAGQEGRDQSANFPSDGSASATWTDAAEQMTLSTDVDRRSTDEEYLEAAYWGMQVSLFVLKQANERMNQQLALECGRRFAYWQSRAIAFASRRQSWTKAG